MGFFHEPVELFYRPELLYRLTNMRKFNVRYACTRSLLNEGLQLLLGIRLCMQWLREYVEIAQVCVGYAWNALNLILGNETNPIALNHLTYITMPLDSLGIR